MPKWYRLNASGAWGQLSKVYRLSAAGAWGNLKTIYRLSAGGAWGAVHSDAGVPVATTNPVLSNQNFDTTIFYGGDTLTLTRGVYTETTTDSNTTYRMRIYKGTDPSKPFSDSSWIVASSANYTGANSTGTTDISYSLTDADAKAGYYLVGEVRVNNDANTSGSPTYDFETPEMVLSRISFTVTNLAVTPTATGGTFSWSVGGIGGDSSLIYSQTLKIRLTDGTLKVSQSIVPGTTTTTVNDSVNISPSTIYSATIEVIANDGWKLTATPNLLTDVEPFTTLSPSPVNIIAPSISPLNNRGYLPVSTTLTADKGTWNNVSGSTVYTYNWSREDSVTNVVTSTGYISNTTQTYSVDDVGDFVFVNVRATNSDGGIGTSVSTTYTLDQAVSVGNVTPTTATVNVATNFSFNISHYPTSYVINWGDGTTDSENIASNTSTVNKTISHTYTSTGTKTVTITAQPGNKTSTTTITVAVPTPTATNIAQTNGTTIPSQPSTISFSSSNNQVTSSWTNGSPITSVTFKGLGAGVNTEYTDSSSPFITSDVSNFSSTGTYTATVTNTNGSLVARVSWNQANASSYTINFTGSNTGNDSISDNSTASSVSVDIPWSTIDGTFRMTGLTVYSGANQTGVSSSYSTGFSAISINPQSSVRSNSVSLTAVYTITYNANGGTVTPTSVNVNGGSSVTLPTPARSGYTFNGWYTASSGGTFIGAAGSSYTPTASITLFAQWTLITATASGFARSDSTATPSQPSTISFSSSNNQVTSSWTNGSPITSVKFKGVLGSTTLTEYTDSTSPFITSDTTSYGSSNTYTATVTNYNNNLQVTVSWNQTNAASYKINYSSSVFGANEQNGNATGSSVSVPINWTTGDGSFTFTGLTVYTGANQTGASTFYSTGLSAITPQQKFSERSNSVSLTYTLPKLATPTNVSASDNRTDGVNITWTAVSEAAYYGVWYGPTPSYDSTPDFGGPSNPSLITGTSYLDTSIGSGVTRDYYVQAFRSGNPTGTKSNWGGPDSGTRLAVVSPPTIITNPSVSPSSGTAGSTQFSSTTGSWTNSPTSYSYQWRFLDGTSWIAISGATSSTYTPPSNYVSLYGSSLRCYVTATNSGGSNTANSNTVTVSAGSSTGATSIGYISPTTAAVNVTTGSGSIPDDGFFTLNLPFTTYFNGTGYNTLYVGTNSYATFGGGSGAFSGLGASNPAFDKIMVAAADRGSSGIYFTSSSSSWTMRYQGSSGTSGSPIAIIWELQCSSSTPKIIRLSIAQVATGGVTGMYSSSSLISSLGGAGTSWNITSA